MKYDNPLEWTAPMNDNDTLADDLRKDSLALMKLLADEKHKSEALAAELAISKGREEAKQLVINQLEAALRAVMAASFSQDSTYKIAERALPQSETTPEQIPCSCGPGDCNQRILAHNEYCTEDRERAGLAQSVQGEKS